MDYLSLFLSFRVDEARTSPVGVCDSGIFYVIVLKHSGRHFINYLVAKMSCPDS